jgi:hypothetical protein
VPRGSAAEDEGRVPLGLSAGTGTDQRTGPGPTHLLCSSNVLPCRGSRVQVPCSTSGRGEGIVCDYTTGSSP